MAFDKLANFFGMNDDEYVGEEDVSDNEVRRNNVVSLQPNNHERSEIRVVEPRRYSDAKEIAKDLLNNRAVLVNLKNVNEEQMRRITDFLTGTVFAINGDIRRVDQNVFLYTPTNFQIDNDTDNFTE
ncbi:cell division protein SepF [Bombilactobacillus bombi]|uniref:Cell division protein SepF n=1 Tax=Bombilactobacillus bombi TaxID=1303590 RepID=A0A417Z8C7_9LACO|nr:cell division protein SepF [Bombilactobacillus bombi]RHW46883.1 cell division protein SepF [Bombilactobacillus bombi]